MNLSIFPAFGEEETLCLLPSPKVQLADRTGVHSWYHDYAAFSEKFALAAIEALAFSRNLIVFDPFLGSGTSLVAAAKLGLPFIGNELSPFSALISRAKVARNATHQKVLKILDTLPQEGFDGVGLISKWYSETDLRYANGIMQRISKMVRKSEIELMQALLDDTSGKYDDIVVALTAILLSARHSAKLATGSNPVWTRLAQKGEIYRRPSLSKIARDKAQMMLSDLQGLVSNAKMSSTRVLLGDARAIQLPDNSVDLIITSPPYLNRLDYVISQLPQLLLLSLQYRFNIDVLRKDMVGTTKIVEKGEPDSAWGATCIHILEKIKTHKSKASDTYYYWNFYKYFKDMYQSFNELKRVARPNARGVLVIQNSHYKDISIPVSNIFVEMGQNIGFEIRKIKQHSVKTHMGLLSPQQRQYSPNKTLEEAILLLQF